MAVSLHLTWRGVPLKLASVIPVRLSQKAMFLIAVGVNAMLDAAAINKRRLTRSIEWTRPDGSAGTVFDTQSFGVIVALWATVGPIYRRERLQRKYRLHLNVLEFAILIAAVRQAANILRHDSEAQSAPTPEYAARLVRTLENHRKRGKRKAILEFGAEAYEFLQKEWHVLQYAIRKERPFEGLPWLLQGHSERSRYRAAIDQLIEPARRGLRKEGYPEPPLEELRKLVRMALRETRRGRTSASTKDLLIKPENANAFLCEFIASRYSRWEGKLRGAKRAR